LIYKKQAEDYVGVGWVLGYLSNVYRGLGDFQKARTLAEQSLTITRSNFSDSHIYVASRLAILGAVYNELGDYQKARSLFEESLHIYEKEYGKNHNDTARVLKLLGETYCLEGDVETAEELLNKALLVFQLKKSPEAYKSLESLGDLYLKKGKIATAEGDFKHAQSYNIQALNYFNQALAMTKEYFQEDSPHTLRIKVKLNSMPMAQVA
jgi:tetratricopeptide (TPR) repeat protein